MYVHVSDWAWHTYAQFSAHTLVHVHTSHTRRGQNILHILAKYAKENASGIFSMILEVSPSFPVDLPDADGNSRKFFILFRVWNLGDVTSNSQKQ